MASKGLHVVANFPIVFPVNLIQDLAIQMQTDGGFENLTQEQWAETINKAMYAQGCLLRFLRKHLPSEISEEAAAYDVAAAVQEAMEQRGEAIAIQGPGAMQESDAAYIVIMLNQVLAACNTFVAPPEEPTEGEPEENEGSDDGTPDQVE